MIRILITSVALLLGTSASGQGLNPNQGLYFDPALASQGFGVGISERTDGPPALTLTWYTYNEDGHPTWYLGTADLVDNRSTVAMSRYSLDEDGAVTAVEVGLISIEFVTPDRAVLDFELNGESGAQNLERILPVGGDTMSTIQTGLWFPPATPGWGLNWLREGQSEAAILYIYDQQGEAVWAITDAVSAGRADLLLFSDGNCPSCPAATASFERQGFLEREFLSATEAISTVDLMTDVVAWQVPDAELTTLTSTDDALTEALEAALYDGDYAVGGKPAEIIDAAMAALLGGLSDPGGKGGACITTSTVPETLGIPLPSAFQVEMSADGDCVLPNGERFSGSVELDVTSFAIGLGGLQAEADSHFNDFRRNGLLIADGTVGLMVDASGFSSRLNGTVAMSYQNVLTGSGVANGQIEAVLTGLAMTPDAAGTLLAGQLVNGYAFTLTDFTLDRLAVDGTIAIVHETTPDERTSDIAASLVGAAGPIELVATLTRTVAEINGSNVLTLTLNTDSAAQFGDYVVTIDQLVFAPQLCTYNPIAGTVTLMTPVGEVVWAYDESCGKPSGT